jgi:hypothetical protein
MHLLTHSSFACNQEYSIESGASQDQDPAPGERADLRIAETEKSRPPASNVERHPISGSATSPPDLTSRSMSWKDSIQGSKATNAEKVTIPYANEKGAGSQQHAIDAPCEIRSTATKEPQSVYELELKLFKNLAIRVVPKAAPLMPMLQRVREPSNDSIPFIRNSGMPFEMLPPEAKTLPRDLDLREERVTTKPSSGSDDLALVAEPTRHVDYLGHDWNEDDLILSWRFVTKNRQTMQNSTRLENAAWRVWAQQRDNLGTVTPESLDWMKECDLVWLYGPLLPAPWIRGHPKTEVSTSAAIWKRWRSENSLLKRATALLEAKEEASLHELPKESFSDPTSSSSSTIVSTISTPLDHERDHIQRTTSPDTKHVSFDDVVQQAQAIEIENVEWNFGYSDRVHDDDKDNASPSLDQSNGLRTIMTLPRTNLRPLQEERYTEYSAWPSQRAPSVTERPELETLRPAQPFRNFLIDDDEDIMDEPCQPLDPSFRRHDGIFCNIEEDVDPDGVVGLFGNAVNMVNTAKDMAYLLWRKQGQNDTSKHAVS